MKEVIVSMIAALMDFLAGGIGGQEMYDMLIDNPLNSTIFDGLWDITISIAYGMTAIYFVYECNNKWAFEGNDISAKSFAAPFIKAIVAIIIIGNSKTVFSSMWSVVTDFAGSAFAIDAGAASMGDVDLTGGSLSKAQAIASSLGILQLVGLLFFALLGWLISQIVNLIYKYKILMFKIEFNFRMGISPIALADAFNGAQSNSVRWLKSFFGLALYGAAFVVIPKIGPALVGNEMVNDFNAMWSGSDFVVGPIDFFKNAFMLMIIPIAELGVLGAIQQACKEVAS